MCSDTHSVGVTQDRGRAISSVGVTAAHELGHIFNMGHDGSEWYIFIYIVKEHDGLGVRIYCSNILQFVLCLRIVVHSVT